MNYQELQEAKQTFRLHALEKEMKPIYNARNKFVRRFSPAKISSMAIDDYVEGKQSKTSFCYGIEISLDKLGSIKGQWCSKFGIWYSSKKKDYKFEKRLGKDYKSVFEIVKQAILELLEAGKKHQYDRIVDNPLNSTVKGKILSIYYPDDYLNIFSSEHLDYYLKSLDLDTPELMKQNVVYKRDALLAFKNSDKDMKKWSIDMFATFLYTHYPKFPAKAEEMAVKSKDEELEFPTVDSGDIQFVDLQLTSGKQTTTSKTHSATSSPDYEKEARKYKKLGDRGESIVYKVEIRRLKEELSITEAKAKKLIKWVSRENDAYGYDIQSVNKDNTPRYIEVKATQRKVGDMDFYYTENEYETAKKYGEDYYIYVVYEILTQYPKVWVIKNPFEDGEGVKMKPVKYKVQLSTAKK